MLELYEELRKMNIKDMTAAFNKLQVKDRIKLLDALQDDVKEEFVTKIRKQAVADFWTHERELIEQGQSTRDWTPEQIEEIMHISEKTGKESVNGDIAYDINGKAFYGHHMIDVSTHPEYAGEWRNIQALDHAEHYQGAHNNNTKIPTVGYYDVTTKTTIEIEIPDGGIDFNEVGYPPKTQSIFKSNDEIKKIYGIEGKVTDGEMLALKNLELSVSENGGLSDFERSLDVAQRYKCSDFQSKYGIISDNDLAQKYSFWKNMTDQEKSVFKAYEYYNSRGVEGSYINKLGVLSDTDLMNKYNFVDAGDSCLDMIRAYEYQCIFNLLPDTKVFFNTDGEIIGLSYFDDSLSEKCAYEIPLRDSANYLSDSNMLLQYSDYNYYSEIDKIMASQYDYEKRFISSMIDEGILSKNGITLMSTDNLKKKYNLDIGTISTDVVKEFQLIEYRESKYNINAIEDSFERTLSSGNKELINYFFNNSDKNTVNNVMDNLLEKGYSNAVENFFTNYNRNDIIIDLSNGKISSNIDNKVVNSIISNNQISKLNGVNKTDLNALYKTGTLDEVIDVLKVTGNDLSNNISGDVTNKYTYYNCYDVDGKYIGVEVYVEENGNYLKKVSGETAYKGLANDIVDFESDDIMKEKFGAGRYELLTAVEKMEVKEIDKAIRDLTVIGNHAYSSNVVDSYIKGANKSIDSLNDIDRALIGLADKVANDIPNNFVDSANIKYLVYAERYNKIIDKVGKAGAAIDVICNAVELGLKMYEVNEALKNGDKNKAAGIVAGSVVEFGVSTAGGAVLAEMLSPYLIGLGAATLGPAGALLGGILAGAIGYGVAGIAGNMLGEGIEELFAGLDEEYIGASQAIRYVVDPLAIDLDGDGFELLSTKNGVYFDEDGLGLKEKTQWVAADDALLAFDGNGDGVINDGSELFGTSTKLENGSNAQSGFEALAQYDTNQDGVIDEKDDIFSKLVVWQDKNSDGISQQDELYTMNHLGIDSISLNHAEQDGINAADITFKDGSVIKIGEFDFEANLYDTIEKEKIEISEEIQKLPDVRAIGKVASLHTLMQQDDTGTLKELVKKFELTDSSEEKEQIVTDILYFITGAKDVASNSRGSNFDAQKLTVIESFMGKDFVGTAGSNPVNTAAPILDGIYNDVYEIYYNTLNAQTHLNDYMKLTQWTTDENGNKYLNTSLFESFVSICIENDIDMTNEVAEMGRYISSINGDNPDNIRNYVLDYVGERDYLTALADCVNVPILIGTEGIDTIGGSNLNDMIFSGAGNDNIRGGNGEDTLYGESGDDTLSGEAGEDILVGGMGNDTLNGGTGNDTYIFNLGDGQDVINDYESSTTEGKADRIVFGEGINEEDVKLERNGSDLVIRYSEQDEVKVQNAYRYSNNDGYLVENIEFADGTKWDIEEIKKRLKTKNGTNGIDSMSGYNDAIGYDQNETFYAGAGNDTICAGFGDDILYGETGNDTLNGGYGNDTYIFNLGDGQDVINDYESSTTGGKADKIIFGEGIKAEDVKLERKGSDLVIHYSDWDEVKVQNAYRYSNNDGYLVENIEFADGTKWNTEEIKKRLKTKTGTNGNDLISGFNDAIGYDQNEIFYAGAGNDTINAGAGDDILYGETGDDTLNGGYGNDTYIFNLGDGRDVINDYESSTTEGKADRIIFGEGIKAEDVELERKGSDLVIHYSERDEIKVQNAYRYSNNDGYLVENIEFADGTKWDTEEIKKRLKTKNGTNGNDTMSGSNDAIGYDQNETFYAGAGNDTIYAGAGDDVLYGEKGNDILNGENGEDILVGGTGNDTLNGGYGNDTYIFNLGDGQDVIKDYESSTTEGKADIIVFGEGIKAEDVKLERNGSDLVIRYSENDEVKVQNAYYYSNNGGYLVENIEFADGTKWDTEEIKKRLKTKNGTNGNDTMSGYNDAIGYDQNETFYAGVGNDTICAGAGDDVLYGEKGNDILNGENGEDILIGGTGNDTLNGGYGNDTYIFNLGDGQDVINDYESSTTEGKADKIVFGEGIKAEDIKVFKNGYDLIINYGEQDEVMVKNAYRGSYGEYFVESIEFVDGTKWNVEKINANLTTITYNENNSILRGNAGNDTYIFNHGDGKNIIYDLGGMEGNEDRIIFGEGIKVEDVKLSRNGNDLVIFYGEEDEIRVQYAYTGNTGGYLVENIEFADGTKWDIEEIKKRLKTKNGTNGNDTMSGYNDAIGYDQNETFYAGAGNDTIYAGTGDDVLYGETGNDKLNGETGEDILVGGMGNDTLNGGYGNDIYIFNLGDGQDVINDYESSTTEGKADRIVFGEGIKAEDVKLERNGSELVIRYSEQDEVKVQNAYRYSNNDGYLVENIEFADGTKWDTEEIKKRLKTRTGTNGNDAMYGFNDAIGYDQNETFLAGAGNDTINAGAGDDVLYGEAGNDTLNGEKGEDILVGGTGIDTLNGGYGNDTYIFNLGDGRDIINDYESSATDGKSDKIIFGEGIKAEDVKLERNGSDLSIRYSEWDEVKVQNAFYYSDNDGYLVENIEFADGTKWDIEEIKKRLKTKNGTNENDAMYGFNDAIGYDQNETFYAGAGNDIINAGAGDDILYGETGDDTLNGGYGNDTYIFNLGDGRDVINDYESSTTEGKADKIIFGEGIKAEDVKLERNGSDLVIHYSEKDEIKVKNAYYYSDNDGYLVENIEFADGTKWDTEEIKKRLKTRTGTNGNDAMYGFNDAIGYDQNETFYAGAGNDTICAREGDDVLYGEKGNDILYGENGEDILVGGTGNDTLNGGYGNDTYIFNLGDGRDVINDYESSTTEGKADRIVFGEGIKAEDVKLERNGRDLVIRYSEQDEVKVKNAYYYSNNDGYLVENIEFADGTKWDTEEIKTRLQTKEGTDGNDTMNGYNSAVGYDENETFYAGAGDDYISAGSGEDILYGESGNDALYGEAGEDILVGGIGNDTLNGGYGNDTYIFNIGDGKDTISDYESNTTEGKADRIVFGEGIKAEDVKLERNGSDLVIRYSEQDEVKVKNAYYYSNNDGYLVENIEFADGTKWDTEEIKTRLQTKEGTDGNDIMYGYNSAVGYDENETFYAGAGNDTVYGGTGEDILYGESGNDALYGESGNDILVGGAGNDTLSGGQGEDVYYIGMNDGNDIINNYDTSDSRINDKIIYGEGISVEDVILSRKGNDLLITNSKTAQVTTVSGAYNNDYYKLYNLEFEDRSTAIIDYDTTTLEVTYSEEEKTEIISLSEADVEMVALQTDIAITEEVENVSNIEDISNENVDTARYNIESIGDEFSNVSISGKDNSTNTPNTQNDINEDSSAYDVEIQDKLEETDEINDIKIQETEDDIIVSDNAEEITNDKEIVVSTDFDIDTIVDNAVQVMEDVTSDDSSLVNENSSCEEETGTNTYADVSDSDINKMADLIVQEMVETSSQSVVQDNSVTEINNESADVQLWAE